ARRPGRGGSTTFRRSARAGCRRGGRDLRNEESRKNQENKRGAFEGGFVHRRRARSSCQAGAVSDPRLGAMSGRYLFDRSVRTPRSLILGGSMATQSVACRFQTGIGWSESAVSPFPTASPGKE